MMATSARCPPLSSTARGPSVSKSRAAGSMSSAVSTGRPSSALASGRLGVTSSARGNSHFAMACVVASLPSWAPLLLTITGSTTSAATGWRASAETIASTTAGEPSMPVLAASTPMSCATASICAPTMSGVSDSIAATPSVFCAVTAVMADMP